MPSDPLKRVNAIRGITGTNLFIGVLSLFYHIWSFVWTLKEPDRIHITGQAEIMVYMGISIMILISLISIILSWMLLKRVGDLLTHPKEVIRISKRWKVWTGIFLSFFIVALMILVLSSERNVHEGVVQYYMAFLLFLIAFTIFGVYTVGKFVKEALSLYPQQSVNISVIVPNNASCSDPSASRNFTP